MILTMYHTYRSDKAAISHIRGVDAPFTLLAKEISILWHTFFYNYFSGFRDNSNHVSNI